MTTTTKNNKIIETRTRPRPRRAVVDLTAFGEKTFPFALPFEDENPVSGEGAPSSESIIKKGSDRTKLTEESFTAEESYTVEESYTAVSEESESSSQDDDGIPLEVVIITDDDGGTLPSVRARSTGAGAKRGSSGDTEAVLRAYRAKLRSSENLNAALHGFLRRTQGYAENLLSERNELIGLLRELERDEARRIRRDLVPGILVFSGLALYAFDRSCLHLLVGAVVVQLLHSLLDLLFHAVHAGTVCG